MGGASPPNPAPIPGQLWDLTLCRPRGLHLLSAVPAMSPAMSPSAQETQGSAPPPAVPTSPSTSYERVVLRPQTSDGARGRPGTCSLA